ncbi:hypothetical protein [Luteimonas huabeiensis]|uniref:hypothetical protein n=1 Tax=Luteimonas huabeiensis TaxID=1244513 RepID=UPI000463A324|nr:hypothetical protein [Luteimonas huabeiensis]
MRAPYPTNSLRWLAAACLAALPALAACQSAPAGRLQLPPPQSSDPPLNPNPTDVIRVYGRAPESLEFWLQIAFQARSSDSDCIIEKPFWEGGGQKGWGYDIHPVREGERWHADIVADRYLPGHCQWDIDAGATMIVRPTGSERVVLVAPLGDLRAYETPPDDAWRCTERHRHFDCNEEARRQQFEASMDPAIPVQILCKRNPPEGRRFGELPFVCNEPRLRNGAKVVHRLRPGQREVRIDLYDLDRETPPAPAKMDSNPQGAPR